MKIVDLSLKRPILMTMIILALVVLGLFSLSRLGIDIFPKIELPYVIVTIVYPGAGPEEMETLVAEPVEEEVSSIGGVKHVTALAQEGVAVVIIEFNMEMNVDLVAIDVKDKVDQIRTKLPEDIQDPIIQKFDIGALPIMDLAVSSPRPLDETYKLAEDVVKRGLSRVPGIANIELTGGLEREIQVNLSRKKMRAYGITPQQVIAQVAAENLNIPAGHIISGRKEVSIRMAGEFANLDELRRIEIPVKDQGSVRLEDVSWVEDSFKEQRERASFNGEASVGLGIVKRSDANTVAVADDVFKEMDKIRAELPSDVRLDIARDRSQFIKDSVDDLFGNIIVGALLTALVLFIFLHTLSGTVIAAVAIPISVIATFILVDFAGFTLNIMSLMGLSISVGILVSNSIVVLENIQRYLGMGHNHKEAAALGTNEIALAVAASTLTNIVVFVPMAFMSGITGQFFKQFGLTVTFATLVSLLVSFTLTPMMAAYPIKKGVYALLGIVAALVIWWRMGMDTMLMFLAVCLLGVLAQSFGLIKKFEQLWEQFFDGIIESYKNTLSWSLRHKVVVLSSVTILLFASVALLAMGFIGAEFFPKTDQGSFSISVELPVGTSLEYTSRVVEEVARRVVDKPGVKSVYAATGVSEGHVYSNQAVNLGMVVVRMVDKEVRAMPTAEFIKQIRPSLTDIPGADLSFREVSLMGGGSEADIQVEITGQDLAELNAIADSVMSYCRETGGLVNINSSWVLGKPELQLIPRREQVADQGASIAQLGMTLRNLVEGEVASKYRESGDEYDIRVRLDRAELEQAESVGDVYIKAGDNQPLLGNLVKLVSTEGPTTVMRKDKRRLVIVNADVARGSIGSAVSALRIKTNALSLPTGYGINFGGQAEMMQESYGELMKALALAVILTYMLMAAMLESYKHPFTIMLTLPLGLIGVMWSLFLTGKSISMISLIAMVMLVGIVVNNAILLVDYTNVLRRQGRKLDEAILEACPVRLRPIVMTNIAASLGMLPLALGLGSGGEFRAPMAIASIGGLLSSTVFTLYVIPVMYRLFEKTER